MCSIYPRQKIGSDPEEKGGFDNEDFRILDNGTPKKIRALKAYVDAWAYSARRQAAGFFPAACRA